MSHIPKAHCQVHGAVAPTFEPVRQLFAKQMHEMAEENAQLCIYFRGRIVADLWASAVGDETFSADSLVNVFSSGKSLEAIAIASLVNQGLLDYDDPVTQHWPEFGAGGKAGLTIADLMRHEAGLASFDTSLDLEDLFTENIKRNKVGSIIESHAQRFPESVSSKREYHAMTRGWIVNEVFRRVDPAGRTIGEYLREDLSGPLNADVVVGVREQEMGRISPIKPLGFGYQLLQGLIPRFLGRRIVHNIFQIMGRLIRLLPSLIKARRQGVPPPLTGMQGLGFFNEPGFARGETPSANATCSARGLAKVAAMLAGGGRWEGREYLGTAAWQAMHDKPVPALMGSLLTTRFTQGGVDNFTTCSKDSTTLQREFNEGREGFYGWMGLGGSIFQWHPELDIGFAFVPTSLHVLDFFNERGKALQAETLKCAAREVRSPMDGSSGSEPGIASAGEA